MGMDIIWFESIDSTNKEALRRIDDVNDSTVLAAEYQTAGRGQKGTSWESAPGKNLTFSLILKPDMVKAENQFIISQIAAVAVAEYLRDKSLDLTIKWPNEIYVGNKKIAGILIENFIEGDRLSASIVGIGININQVNFDSDAPNPVSLRQITNREYDLKEEMEKLAGIFYDIYYPFKTTGSGNLTEIVSNNYHNSLYRLEEFHRFQETPSGEIFEGRIVGTDSNACLKIEKRDGTLLSYAFKEIKYLDIK